MAKYDVYHITGMNMPIMLEAMMLRHREGITPAEICQHVMNLSKDVIKDVKECLAEVE